jgi:hypothetical protein
MAPLLTPSAYCTSFSKRLLGWKVVRLWQPELGRDFDPRKLVYFPAHN